MKYSGFFVKDFQWNEDKISLIGTSSSVEEAIIRAQFVEITTGIVLSCDVKIHGDNVEVLWKSCVEKMLADNGRWEVYLVTENYLLRVEHYKNKNRKRILHGKKVKPYKSEGVVYDRSCRFSEPLSKRSEDGHLLLARYTRYWQLLIQRFEEVSEYLYRYYFCMERLYLENGDICVKVGEERHGFEVVSVILYQKGSEEKYSMYPDANGIFRIPLTEINWQPFFWLFRVEVKKDGKLYKCKIRNHKRGFCGEIKEKMGDNYLFSYYTSRNNMILHYRPYEEYDDEKYRKREKLAVFLYRMFKPYWDSKRIVLMYEKFCKCAQDNAWYLFDYYMKNGGRDRRRTYYIIDKREPDYRQVEKYDKHVLDFMSLKHMIYLQAASLFVSTDTIKHAYQWRAANTTILRALLKKKRHVFLQHGVLALKKVHYIYRKGGSNSSNLFIASSPIEKKVIMDFFRYAEEEVPITGLARWDVLEDRQKTPTILLMPTWRNWIVEVTQETFVETEYYKNYMALLQSKKLEELLEKYGVKLIFCMHPKFREFIGEFKTAGDSIQLFDYDAKPINQQVMEASLMVTDYSSVSWDMYYMGKPVVFYQFDYDHYMEEQGSYIDMTKDLYGDRVTTEEDLMKLLEEYMVNGFQEKEKFATMRDELLPCRDRKHCERIAKAIHDYPFTTWQKAVRKLKKILGIQK